LIEKRVTCEKEEHEFAFCMLSQSTAMFIRQLARSPPNSLPMTWITPQIAAAAAGEHKNLHRCSESVTVSFSFPFQKKPAILLLALT